MEIDVASSISERNSCAVDCNFLMAFVYLGTSPLLLPHSLK